MSLKATFFVPHPPLIIPSIGKGLEEQIRTTIDSYDQIAREISDLEPETIIISSPHTKIYSDYFQILSEQALSGNFYEFGAPDLIFNEENDLELVNKIEEICKLNNFPAGKLEKDIPLDHGTMIPLYFIRKYLSNYKIVVIGLSGLSYPDHYRMGTYIKQAIDELDKDVVYIASGDLSHKLKEDGPYGYIEEGPLYDQKIIDTCSKANFEELLKFDPLFCDRAAECGHRSFIIAAGVLDGIDVKPKFYSHEDVTGVGYGIFSYYPIVEDYERHFLDKYLQKEKNKLNEQYASTDDYVLLAKQTIEEYIRNHKKLTIPKDINKELLDNKAGVFVSIHKHNNLRGCIGTIVPTQPSIAEEIINNAISASTKDPRFEPITEDELEYLEINVDVLFPPTKATKEELDVKKYGIIVTSGYKRGLLLPNLDGVDTIEEQIQIALSKGNISPNEDYTLEKFEVIRHK